MTRVPQETHRSEAITLRINAPLAFIRLHDGDGRNHLSKWMCDKLAAVIYQAASSSDICAIVLEGLPEYFCAGISADLLLSRSQHHPVKAWTAVWALMRSIVECPVPVVAAAQGHALGGGLLLALYCDVTIMSERSRYAANFLVHGFTPCCGATFLLPHVMGTSLGTEMLYTGRTYPGRYLAERGAGVIVTAHDEVGTEARRVATHIAQAPRRSAELAKSQLVKPIRNGAQIALSHEISAHEETVASDEARRRLRMLQPRLR